MTISEEKKIEMFTKCLEYETLFSIKTYDNEDYYALSEGAFNIIDILGLGSEYINWSYGKEWDIYSKKVVTYDPVERIRNKENS